MNKPMKLNTDQMRRMPLVAALLALSCLFEFTAFALNPSLPPASNFDLSHWKLQLPVDSNGTNIGNASEQSITQLAAGYQSVYFYTATNDGAMTFWAPDDGATTSGSTHPRSELREELVPGSTSVNWTANGIHVLNVTCVVSNVPSDTKKVCIGQAHEQVSGGPTAVPMVMIMFYNNTVYADIWPDGNVDNSSAYQYGSFNLGTTITYKMAFTNGVLSLTVGNSNRTFNFFGSGYANWQTNTVYFKAGDYNQTTDTCSCWNDGAKVAMYALTRFHSPSITNHPAGTNVSAGQNVILNVGANGNDTLAYQWKRNGNNLAQATNASLTVNNVSTNNSGNYSVVVTDYTGSVTSSVATVTAVYPAVITQSSLSSNLSSFRITATGTSNQAYILLASTNFSPPVSWTPLATNNAGGAGLLSFTDTLASAYSRRFYRITNK